MKQLFRPTSLLFYLLVIIVFFFLGAFFAGITDAGKGQGLAGGAIVFWYGLNFAFFALILALIFAYNSATKFIARMNKILGILFLIVLIVFVYLFLSKKNANAGKSISGILIENIDGNLKQDQDSIIGLGFFTPDFVNSTVIYFYGNPYLEKSVSHLMPFDSLVFKRSEHDGFEISYAPAWFLPEKIKMDYDILLIKIQSLMRDYAEVLVNTSTAKTAYVRRDAGGIKLWPEFLLNVHSVEFLSDSEHPVFVKPLDHAGEVNYKYEIMHPLVIKDSWMQVELLDDDYKLIGKGWIRWRHGEKILIRYNLLS